MTGASLHNPDAHFSEAKRSLTLRGANLLGIGSMVGAGVFALPGEAGAIARAAVGVSFLAGGIIGLLQVEAA